MARLFFLVTKTNIHNMVSKFDYLGFVDPREDRELHLYIYTPLTIDTCPSTNICEDNQIKDCWVSTKLGDTTSLVGIKTCSTLISFSSDVCFSATYIAQHKPGIHCVLLKGESYLLK